MATESLIVELDAKTQKLDAKLKATDARLKDLEDQTKRNDLSLADMARSGLKVGTALVAATASVTAFVVANAKSVKELELLSKQSKLSIDEFKALSFATNQYGVSAEQAADISKDLADKVGEFSTVGTGAFQDFVDVVGLTKEQGMELAREFENLSSDQVLGRMVSMMEASGASGNQMTFVMESMGNEASRLIPLFKDQSKELGVLTDRYNDINGSMKISEQQQKELTNLATNWDSLTTALGNSATAISATLAPVLNDFINDVIQIVPNATQAIVDFLNTFKSAENINNIDAIDRQIASLNEQIEQIPESVKKAKMTGGGLLGFSSESLAEAQGRDPVQERVDKLKEQIRELQEQREKLVNEQKLIADAARPEGGEIGGESGGEVTDPINEQNLIADATRPDGGEISGEAGGEVTDPIEIKEDQNNSLLQLSQDFYSQELGIQLDAIAASEKAQKDAMKRDEQLQKAFAKNKLGYAMQLSKGLGAINSAFLEDNKAINAGLIVADTAAAAMAATKAAGGNPLAAIPTILFGLAQLKNNASSTKGGGSISGSTFSSDTTSQQQAAQETPEPEVDVTIGDVSTGQTNSVTLMLEDGTQIAEGLLESQNDAESNGRGDTF